MRAPSVPFRFAFSAILISLAATPTSLWGADHIIDGGTSTTVPGSQTSPWTIDGALTVGDVGIGSLSITAGGQVFNQAGLLGNATGSSGTVTVSGTGSLWDTMSETQGLTIGRQGNGILNISAGGEVKVLGGLYIGDGVSGGGIGTGSVTVTGTGSKITSLNILLGRNSGSSGSLTISAGATVSSSQTYLGSSGTGTGTGTVVVTGAGSTWSPIGVGVRGQNSSLLIENGATVNSTGQFTVSGVDTSTTIDGAGSALTVTASNFTLQSTGPNAKTTVKNGAKFELTGTTQLLLGSSTGNTLSIESGSTMITNGPVYIGNTANTTSTMVVTGTGTTWTSAQHLVVTRNGTAGDQGNSSLTIADGAKVTVINGTGRVTLGNAANTTGILRIGAGAGAGILEAAEVTANTAATATGRVYFNHTGTLSFSPNLTSARLGVYKLGSGTTILTGTSNYGLATAVDEGVLLNNGTLGATAITVADDASFGGTGTHTGTILFQSGSTVTPGSGGVGLLGTGAMTFAAEAGYLWEIGDAAGIAGTGWDLLNVTGSLSLSSTINEPFRLTLEAIGPLTSFDPDQNYQFTIATASSGITGFNAAAFSIDANGLLESTPGNWALELSGDSTSLILTYSVPEPSALGLLALGGAFLLRRRRS